MKEATPPMEEEERGGKESNTSPPSSSTIPFFTDTTSPQADASSTSTSLPMCNSCGAADLSSLNISSVKPSQKEINMTDRIANIYSFFREEMLTSLKVAPMTYFSDSCAMSLPLGVLATCLTAATLSATNSELKNMGTNASNFNLFSSIERFRTTLCAHAMPCNVWRTGYWGSSSSKNKNTPFDEYFGEDDNIEGESSATTSTAPFRSLFTATVSPNNPHSQRDIRRQRDRRVALSPWRSIQLTHPRYRALHVDGNRIEFDISRGVYTSSSSASNSHNSNNNAAHNVGYTMETVRNPLDVSPRRFFQRILNLSRSLKRFVSEKTENEGEGGFHRRRYQQHFPSIIMFQGDSLHRGLMYASVQRLREISLRSNATHPVDANIYDVLPPVPSAGTQGQAIYFMYPGVPGSRAGMVDVLIDRARDDFSTTPAEKFTYLQQRRKCAEALRNLVVTTKNETRERGITTTTTREDYVQQLVIKFISSPMIFLPVSASSTPTVHTTASSTLLSSIHNATYAPKALLPSEGIAELISYTQIICGVQGGANGSKIVDPREMGHYCPVVILHYLFQPVQQHPMLDSWSPEAAEARKALHRQLLTKKERGRQLQYKPNPLFRHNRVGMRVYGAGVWKNKFVDALVNAASFSSETTDPPIIINRLTTTHSRCCRRESCAQIQMRQQPRQRGERDNNHSGNAAPAACINSRLVEDIENSSTTTTTSSLLRDNCGFVASTVPYTTLRSACDAIPDDFLRYEYSYTDKVKAIMAAQYPRRSRKAPGASKLGPPKTLLQQRGEVVLTVETTLRAEAYARALTLIWESATSPTTESTNITTTTHNNYSSNSGNLFMKWCQSLEKEGALNTDFTLRSRLASVEIQSLCGRSTQIIDAIRSVARHSTTHFYDALLMRSLTPFASTDVVHNDCSTQAVLRGKRDFAHLLPPFLKSLPRLFSFPNNSLQALATASQSMCISPTIDAGGLASLLFFKFPTHFSEVAAMGIRDMQDSIPVCLDGSMDVGLPVVVSDDFCRSTSQRSEVSLIFGPLTDN